MFKIFVRNLSPWQFVFAASTEFSANIIAHKYVAQYGWPQAIIMNSETGEIIKEYRK